MKADILELMAVLSLEMEFWQEGETYWVNAPWLDNPISGGSWYEVYNAALMARYKQRQSA